MSLCLDLDIGNTNTKWRCGESIGTLVSPSIPQMDGDISRVRVATVAGSRDTIASDVAKKYNLVPEFAETQSEQCGVKNAYPVPSQLGVDRWMAILAAWNKCKTGCVVVDAGTALTIDVVDPQGKHLGGYIVPGLATMRRTLFDTTRDVKVDEEGLPSDIRSYPANTDDAVRVGVRTMANGLIANVISDCSQRWPGKLQVFLCGGEGRAFIDANCHWCPNLVLDGIDLALP